MSRKPPTLPPTFPVAPAVSPYATGREGWCFAGGTLAGGNEVPARTLLDLPRSEAAGYHGARAVLRSLGCR